MHVLSSRLGAERAVLGYTTDKGFNFYGALLWGTAALYRD